jgi:phenylacetate-coenzyme A ligase PaaK-like adenylate-forming protein
VYEYARSNIPFYRERPSAYPNWDHSVDLPEFLERLPLLQRSEVRNYNLDFWPRRKDILRTEHRTSGTTGTPLRLVATLNERGFTQAVIESWLHRICGRRRPKTLALTGFMSPNAGSKEMYGYDPRAAPGILEHLRPDAVEPERNHQTGSRMSSVKSDRS